MIRTANLRICLAMCVSWLIVQPCANGRIIYVDTDAAGANDGSSWANAFNYLQDALADAASAEKPVQIRVGQGTYRPDQGAGSTVGDREATFQLIDSVTVKGGYAGFGGLDPDIRDVDVYETILSGDLGSDDVGVDEPADLPTDASRADNSYHVVTGSDCNETAVLDGFTIAGGNADGLYDEPKGRGGGLYGVCGSPTVIHCRFIGNAACRGGGMYNGYRTHHFGGSPTLIGCTFSANRADDGGGIYNRLGSVILTNCLFIGNSAASEGGGIYVMDRPVISNCVFSGNLADVAGAICNRNTSPTLTNCTFSKNKATYRAGAIYTCPGKPSLYNCILLDNSDAYGSGESSQIYSTCGGTCVLNYCCVQGWRGSLEGTGSISENPLFVDADGDDNIPGTEDDNLRLLAGSPCVDAGENGAIPESLTTDFDGNTRIINGTVDMGAYEGFNQGFLLNPKSVRVPEGGVATLTVALAMDPLGSVEAISVVQKGDPDITVEYGSTLAFDSSNYSIPQSVTLAAAPDSDYFHGEVSIWVSAPGLTTVEIRARELDDEAPAVLYVDDSAQGSDNGTSWPDAFINLQEALRVARVVPEVAEIRVAHGIYKPDQGVGVAAGDRTATFELINGVTIRGGYAGCDESDSNDRNVNVYETILSGDLNVNDVDVNDLYHLWEQPTRGENSYHVVTSWLADPTAVLDGFTITGGNANQDDEVNATGGGMFNYRHSNPTVRDCKFLANAAAWQAGGMLNTGGSSPNISGCRFTKNCAHTGGGMFIRSEASPHIIRCTFEGNWAMDGGGLCIWGEMGGRLWLEDCTFERNVACGLRCADVGYGGGLWSPWSLAGSRIENCRFVGNIASTGGGAYFGFAAMGPPGPRQEGTSLLTGCTFIRNQASWAGAIGHIACTLDIRDCVFRENSALYTAGAIDCSSSITNLDHCIFSGNSASSRGGCIFAGGSQMAWGDVELSLEFVLTLNSCTFRGNLAPTGRVLACRSSNSQHVDSTLIANCIFYNGGNEIHNPDGSQITIAYTDLRGGAGSVYDPCESTSWGEGNVDADPRFVDPGYWDPNGTPDDANDDFWVGGDYRLKSQAGRWDPNSQSWVKDDVTSPCIDAGDPSAPIGDEPFPNGGIVNIGAYGGTAEASKPYFGEPVCETIMPGDINGDCRIDFLDFALMSFHWLEDDRP